MKAFENWWGEDQFHRCWSSQYMRKVMKQIARRAYEAALKDVQKNVDGSCGVKKCVSMEFIREELGEYNGVDEALRKQHEEWLEEQDIQNDIADGIKAIEENS